ncbi:adhesion G-protein coupled receptor G7-like [Antedon mediterranea]|uniref:adhesion G-protein coupled receptor G7-like n=1 Tax=Antedon mediterranea TaxID=105859 RepID=UPI003AF7E98E
MCSCPSCYTGQFCETLLNACSNNACQNGAACVQVSGSCTAYTCSCATCYTGTFCETLLNACTNNACQNEASCVQVSGSCTAYTCSCATCYTGQFCETFSSNNTCDQCQNRGTCRQSSCDVCVCLPGFEGMFCEIQSNPPYVSRFPLSNRVTLYTTVSLYCKINNSVDWQWFKDDVPITDSINKEMLSIIMTFDALGYYWCSGSGVGPHSSIISTSFKAAQTIIGVSTFQVTLIFQELEFTESLQNPSSIDYQEISSTITAFLNDSSLPNDPYIQVRSLQAGVIADFNFYVYMLDVSPKDYIDILMESLVQVGTNSNGYFDVNSINIKTAKMCFEVVYNGYTFPDTLVGHTTGSEEKCDVTKKDYGEPAAYWTCIGDWLSTAMWYSIPEISNCSGIATAEDILARIIAINVTENNVEEVSVAVYNITLRTDEITSSALESTAVILQDIVSVNSNSTLVASSMVGSVNNMFKIDEDIVMESQMMSQAPTNILVSLEEQIGQVGLQDGVYKESMVNVAVLGQMLNTDDVSSTGLAYGSTDGLNGLEDVTTLQGNMVPDDVQVSIQLPPSITSEIMNKNGSDNFRVVVIAYRNSRLFQSPQYDSSKRRPNGPVISFSVPDKPDSISLSEPLTTTFIPAEITEENDNTECVFWDFALENGIGGWSSEGCVLISGSPDGRDRQYCNCDHLTNFAVLMDFYPQDDDPVLEIITKIGLALSITGLSLTLLTFATNRNLRKPEPKKILCNLCASLLCLYIVFLAGIDQNKRNEYGCTAVGAILHYFLLSSIFWMTVQAVMMYYLFVKVLNSHVSNFLFKSILFGWGTPAVIVLATIFVDVDEYVDENNHCFLALSRMYVSVAVPVAIALLFNAMVFILVMHSLFQHGKFQRQKKNDGIRMLQNAISITLVMGLTWLFGFFAIGEASRINNLLFCIFNTLQGFLIFVMYCVRNKEVRNYWKGIFINITTGTSEIPSTSQGSLELGSIPSSSQARHA